MLKDRKKDAAEFQKEASTGKNPQLKDAASQGETVVSDHLQMIQKIAQNHGVATGKKMGEPAAQRRERGV